MPETQKTQIGSQEDFQRFVDTHPNNFDEAKVSRQRGGRHRKANVEQRAPRHENKERRSFRERAVALRKLGSRAMDYSINAVSNLIPTKGTLDQISALQAEQERIAQAEHDEAPVAERPVVSEAIAGHDDHEERVGERDSALRTIHDIPETYVGRAAVPQAGEAGIQAAIDEFDGVVNHAEDLATDGDVLVNPAAEAHDIDLPEVEAKAEPATAEQTPEESRTPGRRRETYAQRLERRRRYAGVHNRPDADAADAELAQLNTAEAGSHVEIPVADNNSAAEAVPVTVDSNYDTANRPAHRLRDEPFLHEDSDRGAEARARFILDQLHPDPEVMLSRIRRRPRLSGDRHRAALADRARAASK